MNADKKESTKKVIPIFVVFVIVLLFVSFIAVSLYDVFAYPKSRLYDKGDNYKLYRDDYSGDVYYRYLIYDKEGDLVIEERITLAGPTTVTQTGDFITVLASEGPNHVIERYYDVGTDRLSEYFIFPIPIENRIVVYIEKREKELLLIVQDMFDAEAFYSEYKLDFALFTDTQRAQQALISAELINENQIEVIYLSGDDFHEETAIIDIRI